MSCELLTDLKKQANASYQNQVDTQIPTTSHSYSSKQLPIPTSWNNTQIPKLTTEKNP